MSRIDHLTRLEIARRYRDGEKTIHIRNALARQGKDFSWQLIDYHVSKCKTGDFDDRVIPEMPEPIPQQFESISDHHIQTIRQSVAEEPIQSGRDIQRLLRDNGANISMSTTRKALTVAGVTKAKVRHCGLIREANQLKRLEFCNNLLDNNDDLNDVIFTDETSIQLHMNRSICYRQKGSLPPMRPKPKHPLKIHAWGGISRRGPTNLCLFEGIMKAPFYTTEILQNTLLPFIHNTYPDTHRFQQDNDPKHTSKMAKEFLTDNQINWWKFPAESCDLNPIEMVWRHMKDSVAKEEPKTKDALMTAINNFWIATMTPERCSRYIDHLYKVAPVVILLDGKATGDVPNRLFPESSRGKSFQHFNNKLQLPEIQAKATQLLTD